MYFLWLEEKHIQRYTFGVQLVGIQHNERHPDLAIVYATEIDRSKMGAEFFFLYIHNLWANVLRGKPEQIILINDAKLWS